MIINSDNYSEFIQAEKVKIGINVSIGEGTRIIGVNGPAEYVEIGDNVTLDRDIFIMAPVFKIGDYSKIYKQCRISGYKPCTIGHNFWCDQNCILNCTDELTIGNNVGVGAYSQLWTHIKHGDVLEGCRFNSTKPMLIGDDVWFVGHCIVSPITAGNKSMLMVGSVVTKNMEENHIYGGAPAVDLTPKIGTQFIERSVDEKFDLMNLELAKFAGIQGSEVYNAICVVKTLPSELEAGKSYFVISERKYVKRRTDLEIKFMKFLLPLAKFTPFED